MPSRVLRAPKPSCRPQAREPHAEKCKRAGQGDCAARLKFRGKARRQDAEARISGQRQLVACISTAGIIDVQRPSNERSSSRDRWSCKLDDHRGPWAASANRNAHEAVANISFIIPPEQL